MACHPNENVYTQTFTPREYQVELLDSAKVGNTIICCNTSLTKTFVAVKLVQEFNRKCPNYINSLRTLFLFDELNMSVMAHQLKLLTNISCSILHSDVTTKEWQNLLDNNSVILTTAELLDTMIIRLDLNLSIFRLIVVDDCLYGARQIRLHNLMRVYSELPIDNRPRILGLVSGLLSADMKPVYLESEMRRLEKLLCSRVDTSSELVTLIRHSCRPREYIVECDRNIPSDLSMQMKKIAENAREFLVDHQYDLSNIYGDFMDEVKMVPDPTTTPLELLDQFLDILDDLGPWGGDQGALKILEVIEKLKVKVPFERHFILLRMMTTVMVTIRAHCDIVFDGMEEIDKIMNYSSPKIIRFIDIVGEFRPADCAKPPVVPEKPIVQETVKTNPKGKKSFRGFRKSTMRPQNDDSLCALVFVENRFTAKVLFTLLWALSRNHNDYWWISAQYVLNKMTDPAKDPKEAELEHSNQEESLRKFRAHDCNIMIATSVLEQGCDLPRCNLVVRFDLPRTYHSYVQCKARARSTDAHHLLLADTGQLEPFVRLHLAQYTVVESRLLQRCHSLEPSEAERHVADTYGATCEPYKTRDDPDASCVTLASAISLVNRYCAKLPSDTFTRLTPLWKMEQNSDSYTCQLRLPINSPVKQTVVSPPMPNQLLARRVAAFFTCQLLHKAGEVDDNLLPIGKENFRAIEEGTDYNLDEDDELLAKENLVEQRPGTTKRRQYYYKCIAEPLTKCHPQPEQEVYFYKIKMTLTCPLPEEQNTRGRKIYPPEESPQGFGILTAIKLPLVCEFPIFTRSGEVSVTFELCDSIKNLSSEQIVLIKHFVNYTFDNVLRLQKYLMLFDPSSAPSAYMIVPTFTTATETKIDWDFMNIIYGSKGRRPNLIPDTERRKFHFDAAQYRDAVVMPWYRNQDQPQYFYVAEICTHLTPGAAFPGSEYATFAEYYLRKYQIEIQNTAQHLLDVDHTSARLNFLTPRYVNRKGVALPTSSEETKRAKRENLEQKQILIPELCDIHPFPASLWRKAVCLPCILYRMNALLLADQVRKIVAVDMGLGTIELKKDFIWSPLNFGWNLSDVLQKFKSQENGGENDSSAKEVNEESDQQLVPRKKLTKRTELSSDDSDEELNKISKKQDGELIEIGTWSNEMVADTTEIGTWSNEMASGQPDLSMVRYASPTSWLKPANYYDDFDSDVDDDISSDGDGDVTLEDSDDSDANLTGEKTAGGGGLHIKFREDHVAEAVDNYDNSLSSGGSGHDHLLRQQYTWDQDEYYDSAIEAIEGDDDGGKVVQSDSELVREFRAACEESAKKIETNGLLIRKENKFSRDSISAKLVNVEPLPNLTTPSELVCPPLNKRITPAVVASYSKQNGIQSDDATTPVDTKDTVDVIPFSFDRQPDLNAHPGPSPSIILQALTMSNANDGINLERLETIGDSFLKYAITDYLYSKYETVHEGKLSHLRSKQVSNLNLYRLGKRKALGGKMIATKFDPHDNWLPPCYFVPKEVQDHRVVFNTPENWEQFNTNAVKFLTDEQLRSLPADDVAIKTGPTVPYNLVTQHSIPDKSIADCVEALIGSYLIECGPRGALLFMAWLGIKVLPLKEDNTYGELPMPNSPLLRNIDNPELELDILLDGYSEFEGNINYAFNDRAYLLQALTHASYSTNRLTDCYQRLEFLGDAVLDYLITRHLYEDARMHSPGALTDLRSALVNNTIFASLAVRHGFHRFFKHLSPGLYEVVEKFIRQQEQSGHGLVDELYLMADSECKEVEDVEVPKSLGDIFESVAGAIFLDSGRSLDAVWRVYYRMMCKEIEQFSDRVPKSPIRELLELEPETAKFGTPEKLADGRRVRVTVEVFGKGVFKGIGRNYRIAKCTAAKCALKYLRKQSGGGSSRRTCN